MTTQREYIKPISIFWWVHKRSYFIFVMRELSSFFVAWFVFYLLMFIGAVSRGGTAYQDFLNGADHPVVVAINVVAFAFIVLHTVTWFSLTPKAMVLQVGGRRVPGPAILASQYVALVAVSAFVYWLVTR
jgi:fumarate reductase subunit C